MFLDLTNHLKRIHNILGGLVGDENEFERARNAELYSMLDRLQPPAPSRAPSTDAVEEWIEGL